MEHESALKIRELKKPASCSHPHGVPRASLHTQNKEDQTQRLIRMSSACLYYLLSYFCSNMSSLPGKLKILAQ